MPRSSSRTALEEQLKEIQSRLRAYDRARTDQIGQLAAKAGLAQLDIPDTLLIAEFEAIASRFRGGQPSQKPARGRPRGSRNAVTGHAGHEDGHGNEAAERGDGASAPHPIDPAASEIADDRAA